MKTLTALLVWAGYQVFAYCAIVGFAWWWVLGMRYPFWKLLVVAAVYMALQLISNLFYPRVKDALLKDRKQAEAPHDRA